MTALAFDREMAMEHGINAALLYQELKRKQHYWKSQGKLEDGFFYCDQSEIAEWILVHPNTVGKAAKVLEEAGIIEKKISYRPGTLTPTTWWKVVESSESTPEVISGNHSKSDFHIKSNTPSDTGGDGDEDEDSGDTIPLAAVTTHHVEITVYDSDDSGKCINVKHQVSPKDWNKAVKKWRKNPAERVMMEFKDTGESERMTFNRIKKYNVRPQQQSLGYDRNEGTAFRINL